MSQWDPTPLDLTIITLAVVICVMLTLLVGYAVR